MKAFKDFLSQIKTEKLVDINYFTDLINKIENLDNCYEKLEVCYTANNSFYDLLQMAKTSGFIPPEQFKFIYASIVIPLDNIQSELFNCLHKGVLTETERLFVIEQLRFKIHSHERNDITFSETLKKKISFYRDCLIKYENMFYENCYIDYKNNYLTVGGYADLNYIDYDDAEFIINKGREIHQSKQPNQIEKIKCGNSILYAVFPIYKSKFTVKLNECKIYNNLHEVIKNHKQGFYNGEKVSLLDAKENNKIFIKPLGAECGEWVKIKEIQLF